MIDTNSPSPAASPGLTVLPRRAFAMGLVVASAIMMSFSGLLVRSIDQADAWQINFYRGLALVTAVGLVMLIQSRGNTIAHLRQVGRAGLFAGAMLALAGIAFLQALTHTTVANAVFILSAIPFITAILAFFFLRERLLRATLVTMVVAAAGIFVMMAEGIGLGSGYGNLMAVVTACGFSGFAVIVRSNRHIDMIPTLLVSGLIIALVALAMRFDDLGITLHDLLLCLFWGGVLAGFANWVFIVASRHLVAAELTMFMLLEFALAPVWVWLFVAEIPTGRTMVGGLLVIVSVAIRATIELRQTGRTLRRGRPSPP